MLFRHAAVKEAAVVGVPDPVRGEAVKAYVVLEEGRRVTPEELLKICHDAIASYKVPETTKSPRRSSSSARSPRTRRGRSSRRSFASSGRRERNRIG